ncbi:hypothetical protein RHSIM_Rhsim03G0061100 [Rhododendron simsii]|uniref:Uncharacterized protein n=1 Tax=Rhododendron simsii TaxID=118357 RepID=A0A834H714_RHOSS|nr:hypothetical protein RHSIM_Rhsim03G0061100 [Rhododendron simsii]
MNETEVAAKRLHEACLSGSVETLNAMLEKDPLILNRVSSAECFSNDTPLHVAVTCGHLEFTKVLLRRNSKLATEVDSRRCTPLHLASTEGHFEIVRELLRVNPNVCIAHDQDGTVVALNSSANGTLDVQTVEYLLGIKTVKDHANDKNHNGSTALDIMEHCSNRDLKTMEIRVFLLQAGVNRSNYNGPKPNPELPPKNPPRTDQHCCGKTGVIFMGCISWFWTRFKVDRGWLKEAKNTKNGGGRKKQKCVVFRAAAALSVSSKDIRNRNRLIRLDVAQAAWTVTKIIGADYMGNEEVVSKIMVTEEQDEELLS